MDIIYLHVAGFYIGIKLYKTEWPYYIEQSFKEQLRWLYAGFFVEKPSGQIDAWITFKNYKNFDIITQSNVQKKFICIYKKVAINNFVTYYYISNIQFQLLLREILQNLLTKNHGILLHASAVAMHEKAYVFLGKSGAGKSTIASKLFEQGAQLLSDDMLILKKEKKRYFVYQLPFFEKNQWITKTAKSMVLAGLFNLKKSQKNSITLMKYQEKNPSLLLEQLYSEKKDLKSQMKFILSLAADFHAIYRLSFAMQKPTEMLQLLTQLPDA